MHFLSKIVSDIFVFFLSDNIDNETAGSGDDVIGDDDKIDPKFVDEDDDDDNDDDVTITDNDVKEALAATSGELVASGQQISDVEASGSQSEAPVAQRAQSKDNGAAANGEEEPQKTESDSQTLASEPQKEATQAPTQDNSSQKDNSEALNEKEDALKEQSEPKQDETVESINAETPPPTDSDKQASDSIEQENNDTPPPDETQQMNEAQSRYAADQQEEKALSYLANGKNLSFIHRPPLLLNVIRAGSFLLIS